MTEDPLQNDTLDVFIHPNAGSVPLLQPSVVQASALPGKMCLCQVPNLFPDLPAVTIHLEDQRFTELLIHQLQVDVWLLHKGAFYARLQILMRAIVNDIGLQDLACMWR